MRHKRDLLLRQAAIQQPNLFDCPRKYPPLTARQAVPVWPGPLPGHRNLPQLPVTGPVRTTTADAHRVRDCCAELVRGVCRDGCVGDGAGGCGVFYIYACDGV